MLQFLNFLRTSELLEKRKINRGERERELINRKSEKGLHTELREEKQEDKEGRGEGNNATGECTAEEIVIDFRVGV